MDSGFFAMGGYASYVWGSFGITFIVLLVNIVLTRRWQKQLLREVEKMNTIAKLHP